MIGIHWFWKQMLRIQIFAQLKEAGEEKAAVEYGIFAYCLCTLIEILTLASLNY